MLKTSCKSYYVLLILLFLLVMIVITTVSRAEATLDLGMRLQNIEECYAINTEQINNFNQGIAYDLDQELKVGKLTEDEHLEQVQQSLILLHEGLLASDALEKQITRFKTIQQGSTVTYLCMSSDLDSLEVKYYLGIIDGLRKRSTSTCAHLFLTVMQQELENVKNRLNNEIMTTPFRLPILLEEMPYAVRLSSEFESAFIGCINKLGESVEEADKKVILIDSLLEHFDFLKNAQHTFQSTDNLSRLERALSDSICCNLFFTTQKYIKQLAKPDANVNELLVRYDDELNQCFKELKKLIKPSMRQDSLKQWLNMLCGHFNLLPLFLTNKNQFIAKSHAMKKEIQALDEQKSYLLCAMTCP